MLSPYPKAMVQVRPLEPPCLVKYETVRGIIGKTQGVSRAKSPPAKPASNKVHHPEPSWGFWEGVLEGFCSRISPWFLVSFAERFPWALVSLAGFSANVSGSFPDGSMERSV